MAESPKVIVTGGCGYIGSHTCVELAEAGFEPIIVDNLSNSKIEVLDGLEAILGKRPSFYPIDCKDKKEVVKIINDHGGVDGVIHFAAFKSVGESVHKPLKYYANNLGSMSAVMQAMHETGTKHLVFSSSCSVYGEPEQLPVRETSPIRKATSPYAFTKQVCEQMIMDEAHSGSELRSMILRYFNPIGAHTSAKIGELPIGPPENLVPYVTQTAAGLREELQVFGDDYNTNDGTCIRDYIHVMDLAQAHVKALEYLFLMKEKNLEIINLGTGSGHSVMEIIESFESVSGTKLNYRIAPRRTGDIVQIYADSSKAEKELGWKALKSLAEGLSDAWRWQKALEQRPD